MSLSLLRYLRILIKYLITLDMYITNVKIKSTLFRRELSKCLKVILLVWNSLKLFLPQLEDEFSCHEVIFINYAIYY